MKAAFDLVPDVDAYLPLSAGQWYVVFKEVSDGKAALRTMFRQFLC